MSASKGGSGSARKLPLRAQLPLLDRLIDAQRGTPEAPPVTASEALEQLHAAVRRDVEALLNARRRRRPLPTHLAELPSSLLNYGIPDPSAGAYSVPEMRAGLSTEVETAIRRFEPRLTKVSVVLQGADDELAGTLRLKIDAVLRADPVPESVSFESLLEPVSRDITVRDA